MGPKKKSGKKKKDSSSEGKPWKYEVPIVLPPITNSQCQAISFAVATSDCRSMIRLVGHYNYEDTLAVTDVNGSTPIHMAAKKGDVPMLKLLLSYKKIDPDKLELKLVGGYAAIHHACLEGHVEAISLLADYGADLNIKAASATGETPLHICCKLNLIHCARQLLQKGASMETRDNFGNNASFWAISRQHFDLVRDLGLPPSKSASAEDFIKIQQSRIKGFTLPSAASGKKKGGKGGKGGKKGGKKKK